MKIGVLALQGDLLSMSRCSTPSGSSRSRCACRPISMASAACACPAASRRRCAGSSTAGRCASRCSTSRRRARPVFGTCAGMIILATEIADGDEPVLPLLDVTRPPECVRAAARLVRGRADRPVDGRPAGPRRVHPRPGDRARRVRTSTSWRRSTTAGSWRSASGTSLATAFHPELAGEPRFHRLVATMAAEHDDPGEGSGRRHHPTRRAGAAAMSRDARRTSARASRPARSAPRA